MRNTRYWVGPVIVLTLIAGIISLTAGQNTKPLSENDLIKRLKVLDEDEVLTLVKDRGIAFTADAAALDRLKEAGASAKVLAAVRQAANRPGNAIDYDGLLKLLKDGVDEKEILKQVEESPTRLVPSAEQVRELRKAGASERLLAALQQDRTTISSDIGEYAVILDCSGSMADRTPEGPSKMYAAKKAVTDLIRKLPDGKLLTFTVYGHKVFGKDKKRGCEESVEVVCSGRPLTPKLKDALAKAIETLRPVGWAPLAKAIRDTGTELLKRKSMCEFLVITDGMETCDGDPALEAKKLNQALNLPSGVNVILFGGDDNEKAAVKKIADEGGGKYYDAGSIRDLLRGLDDVRERTKIAAKVKAATDQARRAESSAEQAEEAAASAKKSAEEASAAAAGAEEAKLAAGRAKQSAQKATAAAEEAREASGEAKKAADTARGMKSEADAAAQVQIASQAADKAADKAKEARSAAEDTQEAAKSVRLALAEARKPREEPKPDEKKEIDAVTKALIEDLKDKEERVRENAAKSLQKRKDKAAVPALIERVADDVAYQYGDSSKNAALAALKALAPDRVADALIKSLNSKNASVRAWAALRSGDLPTKQKEEEVDRPTEDVLTVALCKSLKDKEERVRENAAKGLQKRKDKAAVPALIERVADDVTYQYGNGSKNAALAALKTLAPDRVADALLQARKSKVTHVRDWATTELGKLKKD